MIFTHDTTAIDAPIHHLFVAGWTGRDPAAVQHHIDELAELGVAPPSTTPLFYRVSRSLLTQASEIDVLGTATSGEAEPLLLRLNGTLWLGLASDHTDRELEATSVAASKQACPKPCAAQLWPFASVQDHLDQLHLRSWIHENGDWVPYQDGPLAAILPLTTLLDKSGLGDNSAMLCGTLPALGGVRAATQFRAELHDPVLNRTLTLAYASVCLPIVG